MENNIFQRYELKYLVDHRQRAMIEAALQGHMEPDAHGDSTICSLYCDTPDYLLIRRSLEKPVYKEKIRMRSYGQVTEGDPVFLELKKKFDGIVYKRRIRLPEREAYAFFFEGGELPVSDQIGRELTYARSFYPDLRPRLCLAYERSAWGSVTAPSFRVTFDRNIRWRQERLRLTEPPEGDLLLPPNLSLMEIKCAAAIPLWLVKLLSENSIRQNGFSKYGRAYQSVLQQSVSNHGGISYV